MCIKGAIKWLPPYSLLILYIKRYIKWIRINVQNLFARLYVQNSICCVSSMRLTNSFKSFSMRSWIQFFMIAATCLQTVRSGELLVHSSFLKKSISVSLRRRSVTRAFMQGALSWSNVASCTFRAAEAGCFMKGVAWWERKSRIENKGHPSCFRVA